MTKKGYEVLKALINHYPDKIECVVSARDNNIARDYYDEILSICEKNGINVYNRKNHKFIDTEYILCISWRWLIDSSSTTKIIVFHDSLLPKYRGFAPLVSALINAEPKIGVTAVFAAEEYDQGNIIAQKALNISYPIKIMNAIDLVIELYVQLSLNLIRDIQENIEINSVAQNENNASYSLWLDDSDYRIQWDRSSEFIERFINSVDYPYKGAMTTIKNQKIRIHDAHIYKDVYIENRVPGKVIFIKEDKPIVVCGKGLLMLDTVKDDQTNEYILPLRKFRTRFV